MIIGSIWEPIGAAHYRAIYPFRALERKGHTVIWPFDDGSQTFPRLDRCDVVHVYRRHDDDTRAVLTKLSERGVPIVWDNDDDLSKVPAGSPVHKVAGGIKAEKRHLLTVKAARMAHTVVVTNEVLAGKYRRAGVERVQVIPNYVLMKPRRRKRRHKGIVIGWIAALEHYADAKRLPIADALREVVGAHPDVRVECIGVDLKLGERYDHHQDVAFRWLPDRIAGFDIGIAPLADIPFNHSRSDVKVKEYAASGIPWLASPVGPYAELGEAQGGRLAPDDGWYDALDRLIVSRRERARLARSGKSWAKGQSVAAHLGSWETLFDTVTAGQGS